MIVGRGRPSRSRSAARAASGSARRRSRGRSVDGVLLRLVRGARGRRSYSVSSHQRARRAHGDAVAAVHARGLWQLDARARWRCARRTPSRDGDRECVLAVDCRTPRRTCNRGGSASSRGHRGRCRSSRPARRLVSARALGSRVVVVEIALHLGRGEREIDGGRQELEDEAPSRAARARSRCARPSPARPCASTPGTSVRDPSTSTTQTRQTFTGVSVSPKQSVGVAMPSRRQASRMVEPSVRRTGRRRRSARQAASARRRRRRSRREHSRFSMPTSQRSPAVWRDRRSTRRASPARGRRHRGSSPVARPSASRWKRLLLPHGADAAETHAARLVAEERGDAQHGPDEVVRSPQTITTPEPRVVPASRRASKLRRRSLVRRRSVRPRRRAARPSPARRRALEQVVQRRPSSIS